jgi:hypothetical protein
MKKFEYIDTTDALDDRNKLGVAGWELVAISTEVFLSRARTVFHFKRDITPPPAHPADFGPG